ncbi:transcriptional regulator [Puteibacter caeruleilacunae]|nr:transcriptional regulator [Puteibacter caeruleilacunae]
MDYDRIKDEEEYRRAILRFLELYDAPEGSLEREEAKHLARLMEEYENRNYREMRYGNSLN